MAGSNQNATNTTNQIPRLSSVRVRQTNNDCAQAYFSLCSPFPYLGSSSFPIIISHYHHARWRQSSTKICLLCRLQLSLAGYYKHLRETGPKIADTVIWEGQAIFEYPKISLKSEVLFISLI